MERNAMKRNKMDQDKIYEMKHNGTQRNITK